MGSAEEGQKAIEALNGKNIEGRNLIVNEARPREERAPRRDFGGGAGEQHGAISMATASGSYKGEASALF